MTSGNDPYRDLLNIRSPERPPNAYALLGISEFESDRDKIEEAAGDRMELLQELANSEHMDASQKLLNEVSGARRLLLDTTKKIAYDEELRTRQRRAGAQTASGRGPKSHSRRGRSKSRKPPMLPVGITAGIVALLALVIFLMRGGPSASGNLIVDWPLSQRQGAAVLMDGKPLPVTESQPLSLTIPPGRHRLVFQRAGYQDIPKTLNVSKGKVNMKLSWVPVESKTPAIFQVPDSYSGGNN